MKLAMPSIATLESVVECEYVNIVNTGGHSLLILDVCHKQWRNSENVYR